MAAEQRILIQGGGLAGLALAVGLAKRNIRSTVFELRATPSTIGGSITLAPNALRVLDTVIDVADPIRKLGYEYEEIQVMSDDGWRLGAMKNGSRQDFGYPALRIFRSTLHNTLVDSAKHYSKLIDIRWDASIKSIEEASDSVKVTLQDDSTAEGTIVVGADGIHSKIRERVLGNQAPTPKYSGIFGVGGIVNREDIEWGHCTPPAMIHAPQGTLVVFPYTADGSKLTWGVQRTVPEKTREGWNEWIVSGQALQECRDQFENASQPIKDVLNKTANETIKGWPPYELPDLPTWHTPRVVLIGDAAHAIPPWAGQGSAQAFEDAGFLVRLLSESESLQNGYDALFAHFENMRKVRFAYVRKVTEISGKSRGTLNAFGFTLKKYIMWAVFHLMGGVVRGGDIYTYDVNEQPLVPAPT